MICSAHAVHGSWHLLWWRPQRCKSDKQRTMRPAGPTSQARCQQCLFGHELTEKVMTLKGNARSKTILRSVPRHSNKASVRHRCFIEFSATIFSQRSDLIYVCRPPLQTRPCTRLHTLPTVGICLGAMSRNVGWCCIRIWAGCDASN